MTHRTIKNVLQSESTVKSPNGRDQRLFFSRLSALRANKKIYIRSDSRRKICHWRIKESLWDQGNLAFERHPGTEGRACLASFSCSVYFVRIPLPFQLNFLQQCNKIYRLTSKRLLFWCYLPCSEDSEKNSCSDKIKTTFFFCFVLFFSICCTCKHWKNLEFHHKHNTLMKRNMSSLQFFSMYGDLWCTNSFNNSMFCTVYVMVIQIWIISYKLHIVSLHWKICT